MAAEAGAAGRRQVRAPHLPASTARSRPEAATTGGSSPSGAKVAARAAAAGRGAFAASCSRRSSSEPGRGRTGVLPATGRPGATSPAIIPVRREGVASIARDPPWPRRGLPPSGPLTAPCARGVAASASQKPGSHRVANTQSQRGNHTPAIASGPVRRARGGQPGVTNTEAHGVTEPPQTQIKGRPPSYIYQRCHA